MTKTPLNPATIPLEMLAQSAKKASVKADREARKAAIPVAGIEGSPRTVSPDRIAKPASAKKRVEA